MRVEFDKSKSQEVKRKHGVSLHEVQEIFDQVYIVDQKSDDPDQFRAIGWCGGRLCSVIFEIRQDSDGEYHRLITAWKATKRKSKVMPKTYRIIPSADEIAEKASRGEDVSAYFTQKFTVVKPIHRVNVDLTQGMLRDLDQRAAKLNISRQAVIKTLLDRALQEDRASKPRIKAKTG
jgi:uncharacterized DUF497 family protein